MPKPVYELHHLKYRNAGDRECVPLVRHWDLASADLERRELSLHCDETARLHEQTVVLGGGGVLNPHDWPEVVLPLLERGNRVIAWGIGHHHDHFHWSAAEIGDWRTSPADYARQYPLDRLALASVRDAGTPFEYVPDASCASSVFDRDYPVEHRAVVYGQGALDPMAIEGLPTILNTWEYPLERIAAFLGSGEIVITNSYHGAYWALLLGRKVLVYEPWCSKWLLTPWKLTTCDRRNWRRRLRRARGADDDVLDDSRRRNRDFAERVFALIGAP